MAIKYSATLKPERRKDKEGNVITDNVPLLVDIAYNGNRFFLTTGFRIDASKWDAEKKQLLANTVHPKKIKAKTINDSTRDLLTRIGQTFTRFDLSGIMPTVTEFKKALKPTESYEPESNEITFFNSFKAYIEQGKSKWQENTIKKHNTALSHLKAFDSKLTFEKLNNADAIDKFVQYLNLEGLRNTSAEKYLKVLKWFLRWAVSKKHTKYIT